MTAAVTTENLGKSYTVGHAQVRQGYRTLRESMVDVIKRPFQRIARAGAAEGDVEEFWALRDANLEIQPGEVVGIIGRNGAGKSTLLKILSRITKPTTGHVRLRGRVGSLLEVGTGFHPELTGRENIYLNGAILGMGRGEIQAKFDEIIGFAEIDKFLDTPVKRYSSGMRVRLAFAVAAHLEPELLLVDEVLAVGDVAFQKKCLGKMGDVVRTGRTVLFVSHNMAAVQNLCSRIILLQAGQIAFDGDLDIGLQKYMEDAESSTGSDIDLINHPARKRGCTPLIERLRFLDADGRPKTQFYCGDAIRIEFTVNPLVSMGSPMLGIGVDDSLGGRIFSVTSWLSDSKLNPINGRSTVCCTIESLPLAPGLYYLSVSAGSGSSELLDNLVHVVAIDIQPADFYGNGRMPARTHGKVMIRSRWEGS